MKLRNLPVVALIGLMAATSAPAVLGEDSSGSDGTTGPSRSGGTGTTTTTSTTTSGGSSQGDNSYGGGGSGGGQTTTSTTTSGGSSQYDDPFKGGGSGGGQTTTSTTTSSSTGTGTTTTTKTTKKHTAAAHKSYKGTVASVDATAKSFVVHPAKGADITLKVNDKTKYSPKGKGWDDVKADAKVSGSYHNDGTDNWALTVKFWPEKAAKPAKTTGK
jgi:hypothetical protein